MLFYQRKNPEPEEFPVPDIIQRPTLALERQQGEVGVEGGEVLANHTSFEEKEQEKKEERREEKGKEKVVDGVVGGGVGAKSYQLVPASGYNHSNGEDYFRSVFTDLVPNEVLEEVWQQNHGVTRHRQLFEPPYIAFMRDVLSLVTLDKQIVGM